MNERPRFISEECYRAWEYYEQHRSDLRQLFYSWAGFSLKSVFVLNGAGAVTLLALIGHLASGDVDNTQRMISAVVPALQWFLLGVGCAALAGGAAYFGDGLTLSTTVGPFDMISILRDREKPPVKPRCTLYGKIFTFGAIVFWFAALSMFGLGAYFGSQGILVSVGEIGQVG